MLVPYDNEKAQMVMGWNRAKDAGIVPDKAQVEVVRFNSSSTLNTYKSKINSADIIIINSEITKASKMNGKSWESSYVLSVVDYAESQGKVTVVQSVDKPYDVQSYPKADAVIAVYGCKGSSVDPTEALVGGVTESKNAYGPNIVAGIEVALGVFGASGKLPVNIPEYKSGSYTSKIVYSRGHGITYKAVK
jgi:beta-N-acetylhexosaminidase